jgi:hypothetical protein
MKTKSNIERDLKSFLELIALALCAGFCAFVFERNFDDLLHFFVFSPLQSEQVQNENYANVLTGSLGTGKILFREIAGKETEVEKLRSAGAFPNEAAFGEKFKTDHPESIALMHTAMKLVAMGEPARVARAAGFTDSEIAEWVSIFSRQKKPSFGFVDGFVSADYGDLDISSDTLRAVVDPAKYAKYQDLATRQYFYQSASEIVEGARLANSQFTAQQTADLVSALLESRTGSDIDWIEAGKRVTAILSEPQMTIFKNYMDMCLAEQAENVFVDEYYQRKGLWQP